MIRLDLLKRIGKLNNEKGVAAVLVLAVILVLTALGTIALVASAANVSMGVQSRHWSNDYYVMDSLAENYVSMVDQCLQSAESDAQSYVKDALYESATATTSVSALGMNPVQSFFHNYYLTQFTSGGAIVTVEDYLNDPAYPTANDAKDAFQTRIREFHSELFTRVYYYLVSSKLEALLSTTGGISPNVPLVLKGGSIATFGKPDPDPNRQWTRKFTSAVNGMPSISNPSEAQWDSFALQPEESGVFILVTGGTAGDTKRVEVEIRIPLPDYEIAIQKVKMPYQGNPIWSNAISAQGGIVVSDSASVTIKGDLYSAGNGVDVTTGSSLSAYGNIYSADDVHVSGNGGKLHVYNKDSAPTANIVYGKKNDIFNDVLGFDKTVVNYLSPNGIYLTDYMEGNTTGTAMIYKDGDRWGNVYCRNLNVNDAVQNADISVDGNLWTYDDIQMDGVDSHITVGTATHSSNYIGLKSDSTYDDPNTSSSVINNRPYSDDNMTTSSSITLNCSFIIPGTAFYKFQNGPEAGYPYYRSSESVSSKTTTPASIFDAYLVDPESAALVYEADDGEYYLSASGRDEKLGNFYIYMGTTGSGIRTNIIHGSTVSGYSEGAALMQADFSSPVTVYGDKANVQPAAQSYVTPINGYLENSIAYSNMKLDSLAPGSEGALLDIFKSKTKQLGTANPGNFSSYVLSPYTGPNSGLLYYYTDQTITVGSGPGCINSGIVYCKGNLTVTGSGTFAGTIICEGDVRIIGNVTLEYNESVITSKLSNYSQVRAFFSPVQMGKENYIEDYTSTSGTKRILKRYRIISWQEKQ